MAIQSPLDQAVAVAQSALTSKTALKLHDVADLPVRRNSFSVDINLVDDDGNIVFRLPNVSSNVVEWDFAPGDAEIDTGGTFQMPAQEEAGGPGASDEDHDDSDDTLDLSDDEDDDAFVVKLDDGDEAATEADDKEKTIDDFMKVSHRVTGAVIRELNSRAFKDDSSPLLSVVITYYAGDMKDPSQRVSVFQHVFVGTVVPGEEGLSGHIKDEDELTMDLIMRCDIVALCVQATGVEEAILTAIESSTSDEVH